MAYFHKSGWEKKLNQLDPGAGAMLIMNGNYQWWSIGLEKMDTNLKKETGL